MSVARDTCRSEMHSYPLRQQRERSARAVLAGTGAAAAVSIALVAAGGGERSISALLLVTALALGLRSRHWARLAARASVGARSEGRVRRALAPLEAEGWQLRHSLPWNGHGDIDSIAIAPTGFAFAIETKTRGYTPEHLARVREIAAWLGLRRRRWCLNGALPVLCVVRGCGLERVEAGVLVVSIERLPAALRKAGRARKRPAFLSPANNPRATR